jgi:hypothetical protein
VLPYYSSLPGFVSRTLPVWPNPFKATTDPSTDLIIFIFVVVVVVVQRDTPGWWRFADRSGSV